ncbi:MAG: alkaline phosphatase family protein [Anaerolineales bacterium]|jgi:hypothetical protein
MTDLTNELLPRLRSYRLPELDLPKEFIHPNYTGQSILNIPNSICRILGAPPKTDIPTLIPEILEPVREGIDKVLLILMDALALHRFRAWIQNEPDSVWHGLIQDGLLAPLTSITPSTTSAALTSYWTATAPRSHGIVGYETWLKEYGVVANTILHSPITFKSGGAGLLKNAGFSPETFLPVEPIGPHLAAHGVEAHAFQHYSIIHSGLSQMFFDDVEKHGTSTAADMWVSVRQLWEQTTGEKLFTWVYWPEVDGLSHLYGPDDERIKAEFHAFSSAFERLFLQKLTSTQKQNTLVILTADHGQVTTNKLDDHYDLRNHPDLTRRLHILPTGENRLAFLYIKPGQMEAVREYIERTWPNQFALLDPAYALEKGLFGPGEKHPGIYDRTGDLVALARGKAFWWWGAKPNPIIGRHGGMAEEEMIVPFLASRL